MVTVGMLDRVHPKKNLKAYPFAAVARLEGIEFFYFTPKDVDLKAKKIMGKFYENGGWIKKQTPFPDVIYNANSSADTEEEKIIIEALRSLVPFTSYPVGNKIKVFDMLSKSAAFSSYLPDTKEAKSVRSAIDFINDKKRAILKPRNGRKGEGIIYVSCIEDKYEVIQDNEKKLLSKKEFISLLKKVIHKPYLVQQFITSRTKLGNVYDLRLHVQKDGSGNWKICTIYPRIAPLNDIKANISRGGATLYAAPFLKQEFDENYFNMKRYLEVFALSISREMDKLYHTSFDELGIDVGIDEKGKIWLYEINWHPGVPPTFYLELDVVKTSLKYCMYLAQKFQSKNTSLHASRPVIAVTGSVGTKTTKNMIASILRKELNVFESKGNWNTYEDTRKHVHQITPFHEVAVLEYSTEGEGDISKHCQFIQPHLSIITSIDPAHTKNIKGGISGAAKAKSEIIKGMDQNGILVINGDDPNSKLLDIKRFQGTVLKIGVSEGCDFRATSIQQGPEGISFDIEVKEEKVTITLPALEKRDLYNALFTIAASSQMGVSLREISEGLKKYYNPKKR